MRKQMRKICALVLLAAVVYGAKGLAEDHKMLTDHLIRLHIVGASDSEADQSVKLQVKDAVVEKLGQVMRQMPDTQQARDYLESNLGEIEACANQILAQLGIDQTAAVTLQKEAFPARVYDTFSLPSGVYESLRIRIGEAEGKNWWCVVFPSLCIPATSEGFADVAAGSGFSDELTATVMGKSGYEVRFFLLDWWGKLGNFLFSN